MTHDELETIELRFAYRYVNTNNYKVFIDTAEIDICDLIAEVKRLTRERDAAEQDFQNYITGNFTRTCQLCTKIKTCDYFSRYGNSSYMTCIDWQWRGVQEDNNG